MFTVFARHAHRTVGNEIEVVKTPLARTRRLNGALNEHAIFVAGAVENLRTHALPGEEVTVTDLTAAAERAGLTFAEIAVTVVAIRGLHAVTFTVERE
jgi:hypothetical protein